MVFHHIDASPKLGVYCRETPLLGRHTSRFTVGPCPVEFSRRIGNLPNGDVVLTREGNKHAPSSVLVRRIPATVNTLRAPPAPSASSAAAGSKE